MKKVAVLIPSYKPQEYIERCFKSIEAQTLSKDQYCIYIALNGPKDGYEKYIKSIIKDTSSACRYFYIEEAGVSNARNKLIDYSKEEFIVFIDDDDVISENYLENLLNVSTEEYMGISNIANFKENIYELATNRMGESFMYLNTKETSKFKIRKYFSSPCAKMISRSMISDFRFDTKLKNGEDGLFMARISKNILGVVKTSKDTYYYVFQRDGSASRTKRTINIRFTSWLYLTKEYMTLLGTKGYNKIFILTRIAATLLYTLKR